MPLRAERSAEFDDVMVEHTNGALANARWAADAGEAAGKILLISNDFPPAAYGVSRWYERICATVPPDGVLVLAPRVPGDLAFDARQPYRIVRRRVPMSRHPLARLTQMAALCASAIALARWEQVRAVHIGQLHLGPIALALNRFFKLPYVLYLHGGEMAPLMRFRAVRAVARAIISNAQTVVVNSAYTRRHFEAIGMSNPHTEVLILSVETDRFHPALDGQQIRAKYGLDGHKVILTVGRLDDYKGHDMVIRALARVKRSIGDVRYLIVGRGREEPRLRALASALGCAEDVVFAGFAPEHVLPSFYAACDVFVLASRPMRHGDFEGFGIVFLEAGACGKPVVGGRSGGIPEAVMDGVTGALVNPTDVDEIVAALTRILLDHQEAGRLGAQGRLRVEQLASAWRATLARIWGG